MNVLLAALAALPRIAKALETLATILGEINTRAAKARASARRKKKDQSVDDRISDIVAGVPGDET